MRRSRKATKNNHRRSMLVRYRGPDGRRRLVDKLAEQELVRENCALAQRLAQAARLHEYEQGREIYLQGEPGKNNLYFVISGAMDLLIKGKLVATISADQAFGEFPVLNPSLPYTVTIRAKEQSVIAQVAEASFNEIAEHHKEIWKNMAKMLMRRLLSTHDLVPSAKPSCVFIGHGHSELWREVKTFLETLPLKTVEYGSEPRAGINVTSVLEDMLSQATFAILVLTAEDETKSGKRTRQNVVHEAGLFQGVLGFRRAILLLQKGVEKFSNVAGLEHLAFEGDAIETTFEKLKGVLVREKQIPES